MEEDLKQLILTDLKGALVMVGQAQNRVGLTRAEAVEKKLNVLWTRLGDLFDEVESVMDEIKEDAL